MLTKNGNYLNMVHAVADTLRKHESTWATLPRFPVYANELFETLRLTDEQLEGAKIDSTGATLDKADAVETALHLAGQLSRRAMAYAEDRHEYELRNQLKVKHHDLMRGQGVDTLNKLRDVLTQLEAIKLQLPDYGVTAASLDAYKQAIDRYEQLLVHPRGVIVERKTHNETVIDYLHAIRRLIYKMDHLVNNFEGTPFEREYHNARIVIALGTRHRQEEEDKDKEQKLSL